MTPTSLGNSSRSGGSGAVEFDTKRLASEILKEIGREMGVSY